MSEVVVVTGASAGVGRAVVREFAQHGARIGLIARGKPRLEAAKQEVNQLGGEALLLPADVADAEAVDNAAATVEREFGPISVWVNNAMTTVFAPFSEITPAEYKRATEVTYLGCVYLTMAALKRMRPRNAGAIVQVGSALAYRSIPLQSPYCGAKHAIVGFTDSIRSELIHDKSNVQVTVVHLPAMNTPQFSWCRTKLPHHPQPVPPIYEPEVAAEAVYWAAHHRRREIYVGYPTLKAIYGQEIAPGYADRMLGQTGFESQQTDRPISPQRPDNLFEPVEGDWAAHGIFSERAHRFSPQTCLDLHRGTTVLAAGGLGLFAFAILRQRLNGANKPGSARHPAS
ncbi:MAG TPA: SDR family oxidoreductase [Bryobacteraceae bacterium]|nr:SDR family oxidoreductase [Bryobacteraceae bacterium]